MSEISVLVVEDDPNIRDIVEVTLRFHGFRVRGVTTGADALAEVDRDPPALVVLDVLLPDIDGFEVCRRIRAAGGTPRDLLDRQGHHVRHRARSHARRRRLHHQAFLRGSPRRPGPGGPAPDLGPRGEAGGVLRVADLELDESRWQVRRAGVAVDLSPTEFRLLAFLMENRGLVLTKRQLLEHVWGYGGPSQVVETYISYLRRKLDPLGPPLIHTQRGIGYTLRAPQVS
nr:response regulator transcription factor [Planobispora longispora]